MASILAASASRRMLALGARGPHAAGPAAAGSARRVRSGFFLEDPDYLDPEAPLLADRINMRWRYMDDPSLQAPVLERSNVGMGMLVLNRPRGLDLPAVNETYRRLRDLEVNTLKRFVGLTATGPASLHDRAGEAQRTGFCAGIDPKELLLAATSAVQRGSLPRFSRALLWHSQELAHLVADYRKPLVCQLSGVGRDSGAALACLANFSGAHETSEVVVDACRVGLIPFGGMTYVLGKLNWHLGEFLALTGLPVRGADLVYTGLVNHWLSPEALPFLELTAEKQLEVSESDARRLLGEHSLPWPEPDNGDGGTSLLEDMPLINEAFSQSSVSRVMDSLKKMQGGDDTEKAFADKCLDRMSTASPLALHAAWALIRNARKLSKGGDGLLESLQLELRAQQWLLRSHDAVLGLHAHCCGEEPRSGMWSRKTLVDVTEDDIHDIVFREPSVSDGEGADFAVSPRGEFPLSQHPRLRKYHPDYNEATGLDHDPVWMASEVQRWSPDLFADERRLAIKELLQGRDPSAFGLSRWTRVEEGRR